MIRPTGPLIEFFVLPFRCIWPVFAFGKSGRCFPFVQRPFVDSSSIAALKVTGSLCWSSELEGLFSRGLRLKNSDVLFQPGLY